MCIVAAVQSNYIPWKGYFDLINMADHFVLYDDVQYTTYSWRNRNKIKTPKGAEWLTIPVLHRSVDQRIQDTEVRGTFWRKKHWKSIVQSYRRAKYFDAYRGLFEELYLGADDLLLSDINRRFLTAVCGLLGIQTPLSWSREYNLGEGRIERVVDMCTQLGATEFLSGPTAKPYINEPLFTAAGIRVVWMDYGGYPRYNQLYCPPFIHEVSVIDLIFNEGAEGARRHMLSFGSRGDKE